MNDATRSALLECKEDIRILREAFEKEHGAHALMASDVMMSAKMIVNAMISKAPRSDVQALLYRIAETMADTLGLEEKEGAIVEHLARMEAALDLGATAAAAAAHPTKGTPAQPQ